MKVQAVKHLVRQVFRSSSQFTIDTLFSEQEYCVGESKKSSITIAIAIMIVSGNLPFDLVSGEGFKQLMREFAPSSKVPHRKTIKTKFDPLNFIIRLLSDLYQTCTYDSTR